LALGFFDLYLAVSNFTWVYSVLFISAHVSFTGIWLATKEVDFEEDEFLHSKGIQSIGQSSRDALHDRDRRRKQASYNPLRYSTLIITSNIIISTYFIYITEYA